MILAQIKGMKHDCFSSIFCELFHHIDFGFDLHPIVIDEGDILDPAKEGFSGIHQS